MNRTAHKISNTWLRGYHSLTVYKKKWGNCLVPYNYKDKQLSAWVNTQRVNMNKGLLCQARINKLNEVGFVWCASDKLTWLESYKKLTSYNEKHGNCSVPYNYNDKQLANWVKNQKVRNNKGLLNQEMVSKLNKIGFVWNTQKVICETRKVTWKTNFQKLESYKQKYGTCIVPYNYNDQVLAAWVSGQRSARAQGKLSQDKSDKLNNIGFVWDVRNYIWEINFQKLIEYKKKYNNFLPPQTYKDKKFAYWVATQKKRKKNNKLSMDRINRLSSIGFTWKIRG